MQTIDLSKCDKGDILISSHGAVLEYVAPSPFKHFTYLDHVVKYISDENGKKIYGDECYGTRTNDGFVFLKKRIPETDHDIVKIIHLADIIKDSIPQTKTELLECIQNLMGVFDTPIARKHINNELAEEARKIGRGILESNGKSMYNF